LWENLQIRKVFSRASLRMGLNLNDARELYFEKGMRWEGVSGCVISLWFECTLDFEGVVVTLSSQVFPHLSLWGQWSFLWDTHQWFFKFLVIFKVRVISSVYCSMEFSWLLQLWNRRESRQYQGDEDMKTRRHDDDKDDDVLSVSLLASKKSSQPLAQLSHCSIQSINLCLESPVSSKRDRQSKRELLLLVWMERGRREWEIREIIDSEDLILSVLFHFFTQRQ
jgi:hypothetical protein